MRPLPTFAANHLPGHHYTVLVYRGLMWLADGGQAPTVLHYLTQQMAGEIIQVWAIQTSVFRAPTKIMRDLPAPESPDFEPALRDVGPLHPRQDAC